MIRFGQWRSARFSEQETSSVSRLHATTQLGKLLLTLVAVWGFVTLSVGVVMLAVLVQWVPRFSATSIYALELLAYTAPTITAFLHALAIVWLLAPVQTAVIQMCPCVNVSAILL